jgi:hypothetical protein
LEALLRLTVACNTAGLITVLHVQALPEKVRELYEAPDLAYCIGWSHGKEQLSTGKPDMYKGSYYANPVFDYPDCSDELRSMYPDFYGANIWPTQHLPELEAAFKNLGQLIVSTGHSLAQKCDRLGPHDTLHPISTGHQQQGWRQP